MARWAGKRGKKPQVRAKETNEIHPADSFLIGVQIGKIPTIKKMKLLKLHEKIKHPLLKKLVWRLAHVKSTMERVMCMDEISKFNDKKAFLALLEMATWPEIPIRFFSIDCMALFGVRGFRKGYDELERMARQDPSENVRQRAKEAIEYEKKYGKMKSIK